MKKYNISFNYENHTYTNESGKELSGVTAILHTYLFADMYADIPDAVLEQAKQRGLQVHSDIQMWIEGLPLDNPSSEVANFITWADGKPLSSEVLVTDNEYIASMIDVVEDKEDSINIYDIKTTSTLNKEYVRWQLSIYKYLLEQFHEVAKPINLFAIHARGEVFEVVDIQPIDTGIIFQLLTAFRTGAEFFDNPLYKATTSESEMLAKLEEVELAVMEIEQSAKYFKEKQTELREGLLNLMKEKGIDKWESDKLSFSIKSAYERVSVDSTKLKKEKPEVYEQYTKTTKVKESLTIKIRA